MVTHWNNPGNTHWLRYWWWIYVILMLEIHYTKMENVEIPLSNQIHTECPTITENSACPCYKFEDGKRN